MCNILTNDFFLKTFTIKVQKTVIATQFLTTHIFQYKLYIFAKAEGIIWGEGLF